MNYSDIILIQKVKEGKKIQYLKKDGTGGEFDYSSKLYNELLDNMDQVVENKPAPDGKGSEITYKDGFKRVFPFGDSNRESWTKLLGNLYKEQRERFAIVYYDDNTNDKSGKRVIRVVRVNTSNDPKKDPFETIPYTEESTTKCFREMKKVKSIVPSEKNPDIIVVTYEDDHTEKFRKDLKPRFEEIMTKQKQPDARNIAATKKARPKGKVVLYVAGLAILGGVGLAISGLVSELTGGMQALTNALNEKNGTPSNPKNFEINGTMPSQTASITTTPVATATPVAPATQPPVLTDAQLKERTEALYGKMKAAKISGGYEGANALVHYLNGKTFEGSSKDVPYTALNIASSIYDYDKKNPDKFFGLSEFMINPDYQATNDLVKNVDEDIKAAAKSKSTVDRSNLLNAESTIGSDSAWKDAPMIMKEPIIAGLREGASTNIKPFDSYLDASGNTVYYQYFIVTEKDGTTTNYYPSDKRDEVGMFVNGDTKYTADKLMAMKAEERGVKTDLRELETISVNDFVNCVKNPSPTAKVDTEATRRMLEAIRSGLYDIQQNNIEDTKSFRI